MAGPPSIGGVCSGIPFSLMLIGFFLSLSSFIFVPHRPEFHSSLSISFSLDLIHILSIDFFYLSYYIKLKFIFNFILP
jgi:hypothetical protein